MAKSKEVRGNSLVAAIRKVVPNAGYIKPDPKSNGRRVFFQWRHTEFIISSRLHVQECGFGRATKAGRCETEETESLSQQFKLETQTA